MLVTMKVLEAAQLAWRRGRDRKINMHACTTPNGSVHVVAPVRDLSSSLGTRVTNVLVHKRRKARNVRPYLTALEAAMPRQLALDGHSSDTNLGSDFGG